MNLRVGFHVNDVPARRMRRRRLSGTPVSKDSFYGLWVVKKSQIEGGKHQNDSDVHHQPFPEMVPEDQGIYSDDNRYHRHGDHRSCHCDLAAPRALINYTVRAG
jgi:hypothetical protein